jgi:phosphoribosyl-ATP pyrophosphohydrolase
VIIPSIDLMDGQAVQLVGGRKRTLEAGDPRPIAARFGVVGEVAVVDLDAALGRGSNTGLMRELCAIATCRVGGGIRDAAAVREWLDAGAAKVVLGTAARPDVLRALPRKRVIAALDAVHGEVVVEGWRKRTGKGIVERMDELRPYVGGFLVTFVEREGRLGGTDLDSVDLLRGAAGDRALTIAGGVTTAAEVAALDRLGVDAQVGMALYTGRLSLAQAFAAPLVSDRPDGRWPTVVVNERGVALGLAYSSRESLAAALASRRGTYDSRTRGLWVKGETSGATQDLLRVDADCDRDTLRFTVRQRGAGFCHKGTHDCWGAERGLGALERRLGARRVDAPAGSYTRRLLDDPALLRAKLIEEAEELAGASAREDVASEAADVFYFAAVALARAGVTLDEVERELDRRALRLTRRPGDAKPTAEALP